MSLKIRDYLATKVIEDLRKNHTIDEELSVELLKEPYYVDLWAKVTSKDKELILNLATSKQINIRRIAITLLRPLRKNEGVKIFLCEQWNNYTDYLTRYALMWRILDYSELDISFHERIYKFVKKNWQRWISDVVHVYKGSDNILDRVTERINNPSFPESKVWVYLCASMGASIKSEAKNLILKYVESDNSFTASVANDLLRKNELKI